MVLTRFLRAPHFLTLPIRVKSALFALEGVGGAGFGESRRLLGGVVLTPRIGEGAAEEGALEMGVCGVRGRE